MFSDPQTVTVDTVAKTLPAVVRGESQSKYLEADGEHQLDISSTYSKRDRSVVKLTHKKTAADPLSAETVNVSTSIYLVMDRPKFGYDIADIDDLVQALTLWLTTANVGKVLGGES
jgi:hypothetical protein